MREQTESQLIEEPTDLDLIHRAKAGDFAAFQELIVVLQPRVYGLAFRILQHAQDAEDATQQTFLALIEHSEDNYSEIPHPEFIAPWSKTADEIAQVAEVQDEIEKALSELDDKYRLVFILRDVEGLSVRETAEAMELTESTVKVRLLRARLALRERLTQKFGDSMQAMIPDHKHS